MKGVGSFFFFFFFSLAFQHHRSCYSFAEYPAFVLFRVPFCFSFFSVMFMFFSRIFYISHFHIKARAIPGTYFPNLHLFMRVGCGCMDYFVHSCAFGSPGWVSCPVNCWCWIHIR